MLHTHHTHTHDTTKHTDRHKTRNYSQNTHSHNTLQNIHTHSYSTHIDYTPAKVFPPTTWEHNEDVSTDRVNTVCCGRRVKPRALPLTNNEFQPSQKPLSTYRGPQKVLSGKTFLFTICQACLSYDLCCS